MGFWWGIAKGGGFPLASLTSKELMEQRGINNLEVVCEPLQVSRSL